jgi:hypothetical protein
MRIPLRDLEEVRRDPAQFKVRQEEKAGEERGSYGYYNILLDSITCFHKDKTSVQDAQQDIVRRYDAIPRLTSKHRLEQIIEWFNEYAADYAQLRYSTQLTRVLLRIQLPSQFLSIRLTGQLPRVDRTPEGGFVAWIFSKEPGSWEQELRLPLIQEALALDLNTNIEDISVGIYCFQLAKHSIYQFDAAQIAASKDELYRVLEQLI